MLYTRSESETETAVKCRDPGSSLPMPAAHPIPRPLLKTSTTRCRFCDGIQCFCTSEAPKNARNALQAGVCDCKWRRSLLLPPRALDAGLVMKQCFTVLAGDGSQASEGRETAFPPLPASPRHFIPYCSSEQCPRSLN